MVHETGSAEVLTLEEAWPVPTLADGQVRRERPWMGRGRVRVGDGWMVPACALPACLHVRSIDTQQRRSPAAQAL